MARPEKEHIPIWLIYTVTVVFGIAFSVTIFFIVWNNSLNAKRQEFLLETVNVREAVLQKMLAAQDSLRLIAASVESDQSAHTEIFVRLSNIVREEHPLISSVAVVSLDDTGQPGFQVRLLSAKESFDFESAFAELLKHPLLIKNKSQTSVRSMRIISAAERDKPGKQIWLLLPQSESATGTSDKNDLILLSMNSFELLGQTASRNTISTAIYSDSAGLFGRQLLYQADAVETVEAWRISTFSEQINVQNSDYSLRFEFEKPVYWHEIEQGLIITSLIIGAGVTLLLVALVRTRDLQARELRERNIVIEKQVEEQTKELAIARDKALEASRMKSDFLASMSHEIRTPLNAIIGMSELLSETTLSNEQKKYIDIFRKAGDTLLSLVNDILDLSKIEAHQLVLEEISFDLRETVEESVDIYALKAAEKQIELIARIKPGTPTRRVGDPTRLRQIILNLISNALKFTEKGEISVTVGPDENGDEDYLLFRVTDTGIGIPKDKLEQIFASFTQVDSSTTRKYGGTGLGLTISKSLAMMMKGKIWVDSVEGEGSTFSFLVYLPRDEEVTEISGRYRIERDLSGRRILIVDDNATNRLILRENVTALGAEATDASSGKQALELIEIEMQQNRQFDLALIDCRMPELDGFELAEAMRSKGIKLDKVLMISSADMGKDVQRAREMSLGAYLTKPIKRAELLKSINATLLNESSDDQSDTRTVETGPSNGKAAQILLVEDNPDNRLLIKAYLKNSEHVITEAENGQLAVDRFSEQDFDIVLMDVQMPVMDGHEATRQIRAYELNNKSSRTPIIALTAHAIKEEIDKCLEAGCDTHLGKPVKKATLVQTIEKYL